ncbi:MAG: FUSC family protein [Candidatus Binataceae bacterium]
MRHSLRVTAAALVAYTLAELLSLPQGYWAVFTAILVTQASIGGSVKAAADWVISTLGGGLYAALVATVLPKTTPFENGIALAVALAPVALLAGLRQTFRFAPVTVGIVILVAPVQHLAPFDSALNRLIEISIGGAIGLVVSLFVLPGRAQAHVGDAAARVLVLFADLMPLLTAFDREHLQPRITELYDSILGALAKLTTTIDEARQERSSYLSHEPDPDPVGRTLHRLRADIIMFGRAITEPLPEPVHTRLLSSLTAVAASLAAHFRASAAAMEERRAPPSLDNFEREMTHYAKELAALRAEQLTRALSTDEVGRVFTVSFVLEQFRGNLRDLTSRMTERARKPARS